MNEAERKNIQEICMIYKELPAYLRGKIDGYAEAIKEKNNFTKKQDKTERK